MGWDLLETTFFLRGGEKKKGRDLPAAEVVEYLVGNLASSLRGLNAAIRGQDHIIRHAVSFVRQTASRMCGTGRVRDVQRCGSMALKAPPGCGKNTYALALAPLLHAFFVTTRRGLVVVKGKDMKTAANLSDAITKDVGAAIFIDEVGHIAGRPSVATALLPLLDASTGLGRHVVLILAGQPADFDTPPLRRLIERDRRVRIVHTLMPFTDVDHICDIARRMASERHQVSFAADASADLRTLVEGHVARGLSFTGRDLEELVAEVVAQARNAGALVAVGALHVWYAWEAKVATCKVAARRAPAVTDAAVVRDAFRLVRGVFGTGGGDRLHYDAAYVPRAPHPLQGRRCVRFSAEAYDQALQLAAASRCEGWGNGEGGGAHSPTGTAHLPPFDELFAACERGVRARGGGGPDGGHDRVRRAKRGFKVRNTVGVGAPLGSFSRKVAVVAACVEWVGNSFVKYPSKKNS
jgi:hypothetical protein